MDIESQTIEQLFTRADGAYVFARWGRPIVPVVFGVDDASLAVFKGAIEAVVTLAVASDGRDGYGVGCEPDDLFLSGLG